MRGIMRNPLARLKTKERVIYIRKLFIMSFAFYRMLHKLAHAGSRVLPALAEGLRTGVPGLSLA